MTEVLIGHEYTALDGVGNLGKLLNASGESAVYEIETDGTSPPALIELRQSDSTEAENQLARWRERIQLSHPNLLRLFKAGRATINNVPVIYVVLERAEESLAEVLSVRPLILEEVSEILRPTLSALDYLHKNGYTLGSLEPSKILAVGNTLKLSAEDVLRIDQGGNPADDLWDFGLVLVQAITGSAPQLHSGFDPAGIPQLASEPLNGIVRHCLDVNAETRWTAEQALDWLSHSADTEAADTEVADTEASVPRVPHAPAVTRPFENREPAQARPTPVNRKWIYASAIVLLLLVAGIGWQTRKSSPGVAGAPVVAQTPQAIRPEAPPNEPPPEKVAPSPFTNASRQVLPPSDRRSSSWVVVIASYGARRPAEKRLQETAKRWPKFPVELLDAASEKARLLVVIGKNLSEKDADALRERARNAGLPRDTYIKRIDTGER